LIASKSWSSSSFGARTTIAVCGSSRFTRWVVSIPLGVGRVRSIRTTSGVSSSDGGDRLATVAGLAHDLHVALELEDVAHAATEQGVPIHDHDPRLCSGRSAVGPLAAFRCCLFCHALLLGDHGSH